MVAVSYAADTSPASDEARSGGAWAKLPTTYAEPARPVNGWIWYLAVLACTATRISGPSASFFASLYVSLVSNGNRMETLERPTPPNAGVSPTMLRTEPVASSMKPVPGRMARLPTRWSHRKNSFGPLMDASRWMVVDFLSYLYC